MITRSEIVAAVNKFKAVHDEWLSYNELSTEDRAAGMFRNHRGRVVRAIQPWLAEAAEDLFSLCDTDQIEEEAWPLVRAIDAFDKALANCAAGLRSPSIDMDPSGGNQVWRPWEDVLKEVHNPRVFRDPEPIQQLVKLRVPPLPEQICKMYQWFDQWGNPDLAKLQREIDNPGTEFNPQTWVNPWKKKYWDEMRQWWEGRVKEFTGNEAQKAIQAAQKRTPETVEELVLQQVNAHQIMKMHPGTTLEEIAALATEYGVALDPSVHGTFMQAVQARERQAVEGQLEYQREQLSSKLSSIETYADLGMDVEARVIRMSEDGHKPAVIAQALAKMTPRPLTATNVGKILAAHKRAQLESSPTS